MAIGIRHCSMHWSYSNEEKKLLAFMELTVWWKRQLLHRAQVTSPHRVMPALEKSRAMRESVVRIKLSLWIRQNLIRV